MIDPLGAETRYYYDILGYTYRIVYPAIIAADGKIYEHEEWFFRDANKNVTVHVHPDGGKDVYHYDAQSNLLSHTRADASTVHFAHDALDNLTGILGAEGNRWERSYDGINLVEEVNPWATAPPTPTTNTASRSRSPTPRAAKSNWPTTRPGN